MPAIIRAVLLLLPFHMLRNAYFFPQKLHIGIFSWALELDGSEKRNTSGSRAVALGLVSRFPPVSSIRSGGTHTQVVFLFSVTTNFRRNLALLEWRRSFVFAGLVACGFVQSGIFVLRLSP